MSRTSRQGWNAKSPNRTGLPGSRGTLRIGFWKITGWRRPQGDLGSGNPAVIGAANERQADPVVEGQLEESWSAIGLCCSTRRYGEVTYSPNQAFPLRTKWVCPGYGGNRELFAAS